MLALIDNLLRLLNFVFLVIAMGLIAALLDSEVQNINRVNYTMFAAAYGIVTDSFYGLAANLFDVLAAPFILFLFDFLNFVFQFTAGTTLAVGIRARSCLNQTYLMENGIVQGSETRCREAQAAVAFFYFSFGVFIVKLAMSSFNLYNRGLFSNRWSRKRNSQPKAGVPSISQV